MRIITEAEVRANLPMSDAIRVVGDAFRALGEQRATNHPRRRHKLPEGLFHVMDAAWPEKGVCGLKSYVTVRQGNQFHLQLYSCLSGELLALFEADGLGRIRTGAMTGVATQVLARTDAAVVGIIGAGRQAETQLDAICQVRRIREVRVFSRTLERRKQFAEETQRRLGIESRAVESARQAVEGTDIIVTATTSKEPVLLGGWLEPGIHVNAIGSNHARRRELDEVCLQRADRRVVDDLPTAERESGDILAGVQAGGLRWGDVTALSDVLLGRAPGREKKTDITLFKSHGVALLDIAVAGFVYSRLPK